jgi:Zn-dependent protease with chaperone function
VADSAFWEWRRDFGDLKHHHGLDRWPVLIPLPKWWPAASMGAWSIPLAVLVAPGLARTASGEVRRYVLAHELGHARLGHVRRISASYALVLAGAAVAIVMVNVNYLLPPFTLYCWIMWSGERRREIEADDAAAEDFGEAATFAAMTTLTNGGWKETPRMTERLRYRRARLMATTP